MTGTILDPITGMPTQLVHTNPLDGPPDNRTLPNRLVKSLIFPLGNLIPIRGAWSTGTTATPPTMDDVRDRIERALRSRYEMRDIQRLSFDESRYYVMSAAAKLSISKMMAHYWENFSPFALDLAGAVLRQGVFTAKMHQIDWLHSPARRETMARLLAKYHRFVALMQLHPDKVCVPTLDVDLA